MGCERAELCAARGIVQGWFGSRRGPPLAEGSTLGGTGCLERCLECAHDAWSDVSSDANDAWSDVSWDANDAWNTTAVTDVGPRRLPSGAVCLPVALQCKIAVDPVQSFQADEMRV